MSFFNRPRTKYILSLSFVILGLSVGVFFWATSHPGKPKAVIVTPAEIRISYSGTYSETVQGTQPAPGNKYLTVHLTVQNIGYHNFTASPLNDMYITVGGVNYNVSAAFVFPPFAIPNSFQPSVNLNDTQTQSGDVVFQVPGTSSAYLPGWRTMIGENFRIAWVAV